MYDCCNVDCEYIVIHACVRLSECMYECMNVCILL